ncbi:hypothetical protein [Afipia sp. DC4300-2b1]|uniref:hypothetical protein n=1 Tax=Afipia sp. DC4300-2b1 TaxID=2804672 RepID=UPI003CF369E3
MAFENDPEGYRLACMYAGTDFDKARVVTIEVLYEYNFQYSLAEFQKLITDALASIPTEYRDSAKVELDDEGYDSGSKFSISYVGLESPEVVADRVARCVRYVAVSRDDERKAYERLKAKFEHSVAE